MAGKRDTEFRLKLEALERRAPFVVHIDTLLALKALLSSEGVGAKALQDGVRAIQTFTERLAKQRPQPSDLPTAFTTLGLTCEIAGRICFWLDIRQRQSDGGADKPQRRLGLTVERGPAGLARQGGARQSPARRG